MKLTDFLSPADVHYGVLASSKKRLLEYIGKQVADRLNQHAATEGEPDNQTDVEPHCCPVECFNQLFKREKLGCTALNQGIALPHAKLPPHTTFSHPIAFFLQLDTAIDYEADDHKEVDLIYAIFFPEAGCDEYKSQLRQLVERLSDKNLLKQLRAATSSDDLWQILSQADQQLAQQDAEQTPSQPNTPNEGESDGISDH